DLGGEHRLRRDQRRPARAADAGALRALRVLAGTRGGGEAVDADPGGVAGAGRAVGARLATPAERAATAGAAAAVDVCLIAVLDLVATRPGAVPARVAAGVGMDVATDIADPIRPGVCNDLAAGL